MVHYYLIFVGQLCLIKHTWAAMVSTVLLQMSPSWPLSNSRLIHILSQPRSWDALVGFPCCRLGLAWLSLACLDLSVSPRSQALINQVRYTSQARITQIAQNQDTQWLIFYTRIKFWRTSWSGQLAPGNSAQNRYDPWPGLICV
jgi:hypothetical protein